MRRLLLFITDLELGGTPTVVRELATRLSPFALVEVVSLKRAGPVGDQLAVRGIKVHSLDARRLTDLSSATRRLIEVIHTGKFDTVLSFLVHANFVAHRASRLLPGARFIQSIQTTQPKPRWHWWVQSRIHQAVTHIIVPSESVAKRAIEWATVPREKIEIIPNAVDWEAFAGIARVPAQKDEFRVGFVGRLDPVKCLPDLIRAVAMLPGNVRLDIYGEGAQRSSIVDLISRPALKDRVTLRGSIRDTRHAYAAMDVLVLPSRAEGFGLVLIEAMAAGVPVIGTDVDGIRDVVTHETTGLLVPFGKPDAIMAAIRRIIEEPELQQKLVENARHHVEVHFAWPAVIDQYRDLLLLE